MPLYHRHYARGVISAHFMALQDFRLLWCRGFRLGSNSLAPTDAELQLAEPDWSLDFHHRRRCHRAWPCRPRSSSLYATVSGLGISGMAKPLTGFVLSLLLVPLAFAITVSALAIDGSIVGFVTRLRVGSDDAAV